MPFSPCVLLIPRGCAGEPEEAKLYGALGRQRKGEGRIRRLPDHQMWTYPFIGS
jgi:hypothetical protein